MTSLHQSIESIVEFLRANESSWVSRFEDRVEDRRITERLDQIEQLLDGGGDLSDRVDFLLLLVDLALKSDSTLYAPRMRSVCGRIQGVSLAAIDEVRSHITRGGCSYYGWELLLHNLPKGFEADKLEEGFPSLINMALTLDYRITHGERNCMSEVRESALNLLARVDSLVGTRWRSLPLVESRISDVVREFLQSSPWSRVDDVGDQCYPDPRVYANVLDVLDPNWREHGLAIEYLNSVSEGCQSFVPLEDSTYHRLAVLAEADGVVRDTLMSSLQDGPLRVARLAGRSLGFAGYTPSDDHGSMRLALHRRDWQELLAHRNVLSESWRSFAANHPVADVEELCTDLYEAAIESGSIRRDVYDLGAKALGYDIYNLQSDEKHSRYGPSLATGDEAAKKLCRKRGFEAHYHIQRVADLEDRTESFGTSSLFSNYHHLDFSDRRRLAERALSQRPTVENPLTCWVEAQLGLRKDASSWLRRLLGR